MSPSIQCKSPSSLTSLLLIALCILQEQQQVKGFTVNNDNKHSLSISLSTRIRNNVAVAASSRSTWSSSTALYSLIDNQNEGPNEGPNDDQNSWEGFNPFEKKKTATTLNPLITSNNQISLRQLRMKELMNTLLQNVSVNSNDGLDGEEHEQEQEKKRLNDILDQNSDLLLEPLNEENAVMDGDSIYEPGMSRDERFDRYDQVMEERIEKALNKSVRRILSTMKEYVSSKR